LFVHLLHICLLLFKLFSFIIHILKLIVNTNSTFCFCMLKLFSTSPFGICYLVQLLAFSSHTMPLTIPIVISLNGRTYKFWCIIIQSFQPLQWALDLNIQCTYAHFCSQ
jgi:hypothetical protein